MNRVLARVFSTCLVLLGTSVAGAAPGKPTYLLLNQEFRLLEKNVLGTYPRLHGQALLERLASPAMTAAVEEFTKGKLVTREDVELDEIENADEYLAMLDRFTRIARRYYKEGGETDFFEDHHPDLSIGPVFANLSVNGERVERAIKVTLEQVLWDEARAADLYAIYSDKNRVIEVCTFDLTNGSLLWCAYRSQDDNLFDRNGIWRKDYYEAEVAALFNDPESTWYRRK